jgi:hypothetical protein
MSEKPVQGSNSGAIGRKGRKPDASNDTPAPSAKKTDQEVTTTPAADAVPIEAATAPDTPSAGPAIPRFIDPGSKEDREIIMRPELEGYLPPPGPEEDARLLEQIQEAGAVRDPAIIWLSPEGLTVVDGHRRIKRARKLKVPYPILERRFSDLEAVKEWMRQEQISRRNLTPLWMSYIRGLDYLSKLRQQPDASKKEVAEELARRYGVDAKTIQRDAELARCINVLTENHGAELRRKLLSGEIASTRGLINGLADSPRSEQQTTVDCLLKEGKWPGNNSPKPTQLASLQRAWEKAKDAQDRRAFLNELLADEQIRQLIEELMEEVQPADEASAEQEDGDPSDLDEEDEDQDQDTDYDSDLENDGPSDDRLDDDEVDDAPPRKRGRYY